MKLIKIIFSVYILSKLVACTSVQNTYSEVNDTTNFAQYQTYAWIQNDTILPENILYENDIIQNKLTRSVNKELEHRGLHNQNIEADLLLKYTIIIKEKRQLINYPIYSYEPISNAPADYGQYLEPGIPNYPYNYSYNYHNPLGTYQYEQINTFNYPYLNYDVQNGEGNAFRPVVSGSNFEEIQFDEGTIVIDAFDAYNGQLVWRGWSQGSFTNPVEFKDQLEDVIGYIFQRFPLDKTTMARNEEQ